MDPSENRRSVYPPGKGISRDEPYRIKVLNTINFKKSMHYIHDGARGTVYKLG